ncbi:MAG: HAD hydrolase-like protein [Oscillospiraceae bacterium]|jgi:phosphoglycolate phosphatase|nr:HAD hydrolase-like protein [Oscillospiraceae bacterium]
MAYDIYLFDLDGTLSDPKTGIVNSYRYALSAFGIQPETESLTQFIGPPLREVFMKAYGFSAQDTERVVAKYREYFSVTGLFENTLYPGIADTLAQLKSRGKTLGVATNKVTVYSKQILRHFGIAEYFSCISGDEMDGSLSRGGKQSIIRVALEALNPRGEKAAVMIGDRKHDITGAKAAGIDSIGVTWGYAPQGELEAAGASFIANSPAELLKY